MGERAKLLKPDSHPDRLGVDATSIWSESDVPYPGKNCKSASAGAVEKRRIEMQFAAEAVVLAGVPVRKG